MSDLNRSVTPLLIDEAGDVVHIIGMVDEGLVRLGGHIVDARESDVLFLLSMSVEERNTSLMTWRFGELLELQAVETEHEWLVYGRSTGPTDFACDTNLSTEDDLGIFLRIERETTHHQIVTFPSAAEVNVRAVTAMDPGFLLSVQHSGAITIDGRTLDAGGTTRTSLITLNRSGGISNHRLFETETRTGISALHVASGAVWALMSHQGEVDIDGFHISDFDGVDQILVRIDPSTLRLVAIHSIRPSYTHSYPPMIWLDRIQEDHQTGSLILSGFIKGGLVLSDGTLVGTEQGSMQGIILWFDADQGLTGGMVLNATSYSERLRVKQTASGLLASFTWHGELNISGELRNHSEDGRAGGLVERGDGEVNWRFSISEVHSSVDQVLVRETGSLLFLATNVSEIKIIPPNGTDGDNRTERYLDLHLFELDGERISDLQLSSNETGPFTPIISSVCPAPMPFSSHLQDSIPGEGALMILMVTLLLLGMMARTGRGT